MSMLTVEVSVAELQQMLGAKDAELTKLKCLYKAQSEAAQTLVKGIAEREEQVTALQHQIDELQVRLKKER